MEKICKYCGSIFESRGTAHKFCSEECKYFNAKETGSKSHGVIKPKGLMFNRVCGHCGKAFEAAHGKQKYCSNECLVAYGSDKLKAQRAETKPPCKQCGNTLPSNRHIYCSNECRYKATHKENVFRMTEEIAKQRIESRRGNVEHVSGHKRDGKITVRCKTCETEFDINGQILRKDYCVSCPNCAQLRRDEERIQANIKREQAKEIRQQRYIEKQKQKQVSDALRRTKICVECGLSFVAEHSSLMCCSRKCQKRRERRYFKVKRRSTNGSVESINRDITLNKLIKRDGGVCHICGKMCDKKDKRISPNGSVYVGPLYPSIDHVNPLSKGGTHTWDNVKLAHHYCNSIKSDRVVYEKLSGQMVFAV